MDGSNEHRWRGRAATGRGFRARRPSCHHAPADLPPASARLLTAAPCRPCRPASHPPFVQVCPGQRHPCSLQLLHVSEEGPVGCVWLRPWALLAAVLALALLSLPLRLACHRQLSHLPRIPWPAPPYLSPSCLLCPLPPSSPAATTCATERWSCAPSGSSTPTRPSCPPSSSGCTSCPVRPVSFSRLGKRWGGRWPADPARASIRP